MSGLAWAKVRAMFDHSGNPVMEAKLSDAVQIIGWKDLPTAGDEILEVENEKKVRMVMRYREAEKATQLAQEHKIAADKKHEEYLIVSFFYNVIEIHYIYCVALRIFTYLSVALLFDNCRNIRNIWQREEHVADMQSCQHQLKMKGLTMEYPNLILS